jgi:WD40 repeat protein
LINVRSTRGRNSKGSKITGIEVLNNDENKILITSNDSRLRLYDLRDLSLVCKYKGFSNSTVHIKASPSHDDKFIISGSKNKCTYVWKMNYHQYSMLSTGRRDRNNCWERIQAHNSIVTCAVFSPKPQLILEQLMQNVIELKNNNNKEKSGSYVFVSVADGLIKIFINKLNNFK